MRFVTMDATPTGPQRSRTRLPPLRVALLLALVVLGLVGGHALLWRFLAQQVEQGFLIWVQQRRAQGWQVSHAAPSRGGWPFAVTLRVPDLAIAGGAQTLPGGFSVAFAPVTLSTALPWIDTLQIDLPGEHRVTLTGENWVLRADRMTVLLPLAPDTLTRMARLTADQLQLGSGNDSIALNRLQVSVDGSSTATEAEAALQLTLEAEGIRLPAEFAARSPSAFGRDIAALSVDAVLSGPVPPARSTNERAEAWRDGGGTLELRSGTLRWGPVNALAAATFALDEDLQPMGAGTLRLSGAAEALSALADAGIIGRRAANTARATLPLLARRSSAGSAPEIELPLTIEARTLAVARIPVMRMLPLPWSALPAAFLRD